MPTGEIGRLDAIDGSGIIVFTEGDRTKLLVTQKGAPAAGVITLGPEARDALRELLDRAAMPGQAADTEAREDRRCECGQPIPPGAYAAGYRTCRDHLSDTEFEPFFDRAAKAGRAAIESARAPVGTLPGDLPVEREHRS